MTLLDIVRAVESGKTVHFKSDEYRIIKDWTGQYLIVDSRDCSTHEFFVEEGGIFGSENDYFTSDAPVNHLFNALKPQVFHSSL